MLKLSDNLVSIKNDIEANYTGFEGSTPVGQALYSSYLLMDNDWGNFCMTCRPNLVFLISDGEPTTQCTSMSPYNLNYLGETPSIYEQAVDCSINTAAYIYDHHPANDLFEDATECPAGNCPGDKLKTYPLSYLIDIPNLEYIGAAGQGETVANSTVLLANNNEELIEKITETIKENVNIVQASALSMSSPAVTEAGGEYGDYVYLPAFTTRSKGHWWGTINKMCRKGENCLLTNVMDSDGIYLANTGAVTEEFSSKSFYDYIYKIDNDTPDDPTDDGYQLGINMLLKIYSQADYRNFYYHDGASFLKLDAKPSDMDTKAYNFMKGLEYNDASTTARGNPMGDVWHSSTVIIDEDNKLSTTDDLYLIVGSNEGFLHVFKDNGLEVKAVIPSSDIWKKHIDGDYSEKSEKKELYGVDATPVRIHKDSVDWISIGFRRGGKGYVFIKTADLLGTLSSGSRDEIIDIADEPGKSFGESWSPPMLHERGATNYIVMPFGYDAYFDDETKNPKNYPGASFHIYSTAIDANSIDNNGYSYAKTYTSSGSTYPVTGSVKYPDLSVPANTIIIGSPVYFKTKAGRTSLFDIVEKSCLESDSKSMTCDTISLLPSTENKFPRMSL